MLHRYALHGLARNSTGSALLILLLLTLGAPQAWADTAPMWASPAGLAPGNPDSRVQMLAETVDIQIVERPAAEDPEARPGRLDVEVYALVDATFTMRNNGPDILMKVGFPGDTNTAIRQDRPDSPVIFQPSLTSFRVQADGVDYQVSEQEIVLDPVYPYGSRWFIWEMAYPRGRTVNVRVSYEQALDTWQGYAQPMYVLRTGALWEGPINEATITMSAPDGGVFVGGPQLFMGRDEAGQTYTRPPTETVLGADEATERSDTRLLWRLRDFEPTRDVGTIYIPADRWHALREAEALVAAGSPTAEDYLRAARVALELHGAGGAGRVSQAILERVPRARTRDWARTATQAAPQSAIAFVLLGDVERGYALPRSDRAWFTCWPTAAADAYRRAIALGSAEASERLAGLYDGRLMGTALYSEPIGQPWLPCPNMPQADSRPEIIAAENIEVANRVWASAVNNGDSEYALRALEHVYGGAWLSQVRDLVRDGALSMRAQDQYRQPRQIGLVTVRSARRDARGRIEAQVSETWDDRIMNRRDGSVARAYPPRVEQRYVLERSPACDCWLIVESQITRSD